MRHWTVMFLGAVLLIAGSASARDDEEGLVVPPGFEPFEQMIGGWKGQGIPAKNRLKGWPERHAWSWKFAGGKPVAMTVEMTKGKILAQALLTHEAKEGGFRLEGKDPEGKSVSYTGKYNDSARSLSLLRENPPAEIGEERIDLALNDNKIRYSMRLFRKEPTAPQFALVIDANMGKEGESFAAGGAAADLPKCIVTGGAGTMTVSFDGKSFPICCSGCRDEFNESPEKYVKKYLARVASGSAGSSKPTSPPSEKSTAVPREAGSPASDGTGPAPKSDAMPAEEKATPKTRDEATRAAGLLSQGSSLEKAGKKQAALIYYKRIVKEYPESPSATTAKARIKALGG